MEYQTTGKRHLQKIKRSKSILFKTSSYKKQLNTFCWKAIRRNFNWYHFNITQLHQLQKSILRVYFKIWLCSGNIFFYIIPCTFQKTILFCKHNTSLCSFCDFEDEAVINIFVHCSKTKRLWCTVTQYFFSSYSSIITT